MARNAMAIVLGLTVAFVIKWTHVAIDNRLFPYPTDISPDDISAMKEYFRHLPTSSFVLTLVFNALTVVGATFVAVKVAASQQRNLALGIGLFLLVMGLIRLVMLPHPVWFVIVDMCLYIPMAGLGYRLSKKS